MLARECTYTCALIDESCSGFDVTEKCMWKLMTIFYGNKAATAVSEEYIQPERVLRMRSTTAVSERKPDPDVYKPQERTSNLLLVCALLVGVLSCSHVGAFSEGVPV